LIRPEIWEVRFADDFKPVGETKRDSGDIMAKKEETIKSDSAGINGYWDELLRRGIQQYRERLITLEELLHLFFEAREAREAVERGERGQDRAIARGDENFKEA
jgi:hypothetical protein